ncbi:uncharacterized protein LOC125209791 [Salvia hispanica]|uniref:uncharacterized protein LOC125209791 n=1 Tax=Salvia hispanica TaxID=49212 RepID=UPI002009AE46|nr:uncharacterized protein LOC125209791 [Salvia hispanica]
MANGRAGGSGGGASDSDSDGRRYEYFRIREDAAGKPGHTPLQKCTAAIKQLAYGGPADMFDEYLHIGKSSAVECLQNFCAGVRAIFGDRYLRTADKYARTIMHAIGPKKSYFASRQEAARKDVEQTFGVLQSRWTMKGPSRMCGPTKDDTGVGPSHGVASANVNMGVPHGKVEWLRAFADMRQRDAHIRLQKDIIEEVWTRRGER